MQLHNIPQGSEEWYALRLGKITGSDYSKLLSKKEKNKYLYNKANEIVTRLRCESDSYTNFHMERGKALESLARDAYKIIKYYDIIEVGLVQKGEYLACSPDGLIGDDGIIEIKVLDSNNHFKQMLEIDSNGIKDICKSHYMQMQFNMFVSERQWCDYVLYNPLHAKNDKEIFIRRIEANKEEWKQIEIVVNESIEKIKSYVEQYHKITNY